MRESAWVWTLWCVMPAAALLIVLSRVPLWLTMPADTERYAVSAVLYVQLTMILTIGDALLRLGLFPTLLAGIAPLGLAWTLTGGSGVALLVLPAALILSSAFARFLPTFLFAMRSIVCCLLLYEVLR